MNDDFLSSILKEVDKGLTVMISEDVSEMLYRFRIINKNYDKKVEFVFSKRDFKDYAIKGKIFFYTLESALHELNSNA